MTIYDLVFICVVLLSVITIIIILTNLITGRFKKAGRISLYYSSFILLYLLIIIATSIFTPQLILSPGESIKSDDWRVTADNITLSQSNSEVTVSFRIYSTAGRAVQRELGFEAYIIDEAGKRFDPSNALANEGFDSQLEPGQSISFVRRYNVDGSTGKLLVVIYRSGSARFPGLFIIGDNSSLFHKPIAFPAEAK